MPKKNILPLLAVLFLLILAVVALVILNLFPSSKKSPSLSSVPPASPSAFPSDQIDGLLKCLPENDPCLLSLFFQDKYYNLSSPSSEVLSATGFSAEDQVSLVGKLEGNMVVVSSITKLNP